MTLETMVKTGISEAVLTDLEKGFYRKIRVDPVLGPTFAERVTNWELHLAKMVNFWSLIALMTATRLKVRFGLIPAQEHPSGARLSVEMLCKVV